jgi:hypothetical protein
MDEARHVEVFSRYLRRAGSIRPADPALHRFLTMILDADSWIKMLIGMQIVVEGAALSSFHRYRKRTRDPLLGEVLSGVIRDEARHVGFGTMYLGDVIRNLPPDDREALVDYSFDAIVAFSETRRDSFRASAAFFAEAGIEPNDVMRDAASWLGSGNREREDHTRDGITDFILPTIARLGLITPRIRDKFNQLRITAATTSDLIEELDALLRDVEGQE